MTYKPIPPGRSRSWRDVRRIRRLADYYMQQGMPRRTAYKCAQLELED